MVPEQESTPHSETHIQKLRDTLSPDSFREWFRERQYRQNIEDGKSYFNGPSSVPEPDRHSPSRLLKCHRQVFYQQCNAPEETSDPDGIFWFGSRFEEELALPFLKQAITDSDTYVQNSIWVDFRVETEGDKIQIKGATDPVIVDSNAVPIFPTEIKTKSSIEHTTSPNRSHRAQIHAYISGLSEKYDIPLSQGAIVYADRQSLDVKVFHIEFDEEFWNETVLAWAANHTEYRLEDELPPADPEYDWECEFCSYRERCGEGDSAYHDVGPEGLLPDYSEYPRKKITEYLEAHDSAQLTPLIAERFPELAHEYDVIDWNCPSCSISFDWDAIEGVSDPNSEPLCPNCADEGRLTALRSPWLDRLSAGPSSRTRDGSELNE
jgi:CRISPR/Cas system-associated exonuclease Cas4 (RecB family)